MSQRNKSYSKFGTLLSLTEIKHFHRFLFVKVFYLEQTDRIGNGPWSCIVGLYHVCFKKLETFEEYKHLHFFVGTFFFISMNIGYLP